LRDFAERSVEQARKAFEGFLTVAQRAAASPAKRPRRRRAARNRSALTYCPIPSAT
jgi:hypothetical protein